MDLSSNWTVVNKYTSTWSFSVQYNTHLTSIELSCMPFFPAPSFASESFWCQILDLSCSERGSDFAPAFKATGQVARKPMRFSTCVLWDFTLKRTVEKGENFGKDSDSYFVYFRNGIRFFYVFERRQYYRPCSLGSRIRRYRRIFRTLCPRQCLFSLSLLLFLSFSCSLSLNLSLFLSLHSATIWGCKGVVYESAWYYRARFLRENGF